MEDLVILCFHRFWESPLHFLQSVTECRVQAEERLSVCLATVHAPSPCLSLALGTLNTRMSG
jgi:hypothetical protein